MAIAYQQLEKLQNLQKIKMELELLEDMRKRCRCPQYINPILLQMTINILDNIDTLDVLLKCEYAQKYEEYMMNRIEEYSIEPLILVEYKQTVIITAIKRIWKSLSWSSCWS